MTAFTNSLLLLALAAVASANSVNLDNYSFDEHVVSYQLKYTAEEMPARRAQFYSELARIRAHNSNPHSTWKMGVNKFTTMTASERASFQGFSKNAVQSESAMKHMTVGYPADLTLDPVDKLPKSVDWRTKGVVNAPKDQGHCGSCWAFAATAVIESHVALNTGKLFDLSTEQIAMCASNPRNCGGTGACSGATAQIGMEYVAANTTVGQYQEYQYPYTSYQGVVDACRVDEHTDAPKIKIDGHYKLTSNSYVEVMNAIAKIGPLTVSVDASTFHSYEGGIHSSCNTDQPDINHAVNLVGYGEDEETGLKYFIAKNSWSASWGENGYIRILRTDNDSNVCGLDITPEHGNACDGETDPVVACGMCGILYNVGFPVGARLV